MKQTVFLFIVFSVLFFSCRKEFSEPNDALVRIGLDQTEGTITFDDTFRLEVLTNKPFAEAQMITYTYQTDLQEGTDFRWIDQSFELSSEQLQDEISFVLLRTDTALLEKTFSVELQNESNYQLEEGRRSGSYSVGVGHTVDVRLWAPDEAFPQLWGYDNDPNQDTGPGNGRHFAFAYPSKTKANVIGIYNQDTTKSTNAFNMHRIYEDQDVMSSSARIRIFEALRFEPYEEGNTEGRVFFIPQQVKIYRKSSTSLPPFFYIGITGEGTYSEETELIEISLTFDESQIGGPSDVVRKYLLSPNEL